MISRSRTAYSSTISLSNSFHPRSRMPSTVVDPIAQNESPVLLSDLSASGESWQTSTDYKQSDLSVTAAHFYAVTDVLLTKSNLNSSHLFRADILYDSSGDLKTPAEHESSYGSFTTHDDLGVVDRRTAECFDGFTWKRTVARKLIPRKPQLDESLLQSCHIYQTTAGPSKHGEDFYECHLVVYRPHIDTEGKMPWYHPPVRALAYLFEEQTATEQASSKSCISVHFLPFQQYTPDTTIPTRLHRTFLSLLETIVRLSKGMSRPPDPNRHAAPKDNIIPQHIVQNTYSRLKQTYSADLIKRWVEKTEPSKHVFEDLSIAAFLIGLWRQMYGVLPLCERSGMTTTKAFPGFVDIACGNGVLVYILIQEGYHGWGFDARHRKTWDVLPEIEDHLLERLLIPEPFLGVLSRISTPGGGSDTFLAPETYYDGNFEPGTFIISNHADELTSWTPVLAALSCPENPLPWLAIPCCSHALSGARYRYPIQKTPRDSPNQQPSADQPSNGDLNALRAAKTKAASGADQTSMYGTLTAKVVALAEELGFEVERTLMRIPSTRNIGIIGGRHRVLQHRRPAKLKTAMEDMSIDTGLQDRIQDLVERECKMSGGLEAAARTWIERANSLQTGKGRGKLNLGKAHE